MGYIDNFTGKVWDWTKPFQRTGKFPLDRSSMFASYNDALLYAKGDGSDSRGLGATSYIGQIITVWGTNEKGVEGVWVYSLVPSETEGYLADLQPVGSGEIEDSSITESKISENAVTEEKIGAGAVTTDKIDDNAVTGAKIANNTISKDKLDTGLQDHLNNFATQAQYNALTAGMVAGEGEETPTIMGAIEASESKITTAYETAIAEAVGKALTDSY